MAAFCHAGAVALLNGRVSCNSASLTKGRPGLLRSALRLAVAGCRLVVAVVAVIVVAIMAPVVIVVAVAVAVIAAVIIAVVAAVRIVSAGAIPPVAAGHRIIDP